MVLVLSGFNARQLGAEAMRLGASGYMEKGGIVSGLAPRIRELFPDRSGGLPSPAPIQARLHSVAVDTDDSAGGTTSTRIRKILINLMSKAAKFAPRLPLAA